jgi:hypothetical protein
MADKQEMAKILDCIFEAMVWGTARTKSLRKLKK